MFQDIIKLTQLILENVLEDTTIKPNLKSIYDVYRVMQRVIYAIHVLEVHYLHLPYEVSCLQDAQLGTPFKKWYFFTAKDFDEVRKYMREYLLELTAMYFGLMYEENYVPNKTTFTLEKFFSSATILAFFAYHYESGKLSDDGLSVVCKKLTLNKKKYYEDTHIDIDTHEKRVALCLRMKVSAQAMQKILEKTKAFLVTHVTLEDLL